MKVWFDNPQELLSSEHISEFWPSDDQSPEERVNAATRFIIYVCCVIYLIRRDPRIFVLGMTALAVIFVLYRSNKVKEPYVSTKCGEKCQRPTQDNPMGNVLITDFEDAPNRLEACYYSTVQPDTSGSVRYDSGRSRSPLPKYMRNGLDRQFVSNPVTKIPGDQTGFAEWLYGPKNGPMCKSNNRYCSPDARGVQLEAYGGLTSYSDRR
jgi:hypothetical protein